MIRTIQNELMTVEINDFGAELCSIRDTGGTEYLWEGRKEFWGRRSPILFPFVGNLKEKQYIHRGVTYPMSQHGFARDMEFEMIGQEPSGCSFRLRSDEETKKKYPFDFVLEIGYRLSGADLFVSWKVINTGKETMYFSIGAHPAFCCPPFFDSGKTGRKDFKERGVERSNYYLEFEGVSELEISVLDQSCGLLLPETRRLPLTKKETQAQNGQIAVGEHLFDGDALVIEHNQTQKVSLCTPDKQAYLSVIFDAPLFGIWSPAAKDKSIPPFVCIEPWYGRCDRVDFTGELSEREWGNVLEPDREFRTEYQIRLEGRE